MSQKSSVPQAVSFVSQVLKRDTPNFAAAVHSDRRLSLDRKTVLSIAQGDRTKRGWDHLWDHPAGV